MKSRWKSRLFKAKQILLFLFSLFPYP